jgi:DNA-binding NtrC family response regulator
MTPGLSILIVDDDPGSLHLLETILKDLGFLVRTAQSPLAALRQVEEHPPDLLLTDLRMPDMNGVDLIRAALRLRPDLCCLLISAFITDDAATEAFRTGAHDLLAKPINLEEVRARILHASEIVCLRREVRHLRARTALVPSGDSSSALPVHAEELATLPALPGSSAPVGGAGTGIAHRFERLASLLRQGLITPNEFEEKKGALLSRI